jgi:HemK-related putative methylase
MEVLHDYHGCSYIELQGVYPVSEDTLLLLKAVEDVVPKKNGKLLDMGCGVGLITLRAASEGWDVLAVDREPRAIMCLKRNLVLNGLQALTLISDLFMGIPRRYLDHFDLITFNPPYVVGSAGSVPVRDALPLSGGVGGTEVTMRFLEGAEKFLSERGFILLLGYSSWPVEDWVKGYSYPINVESIGQYDLDGERMSTFLICKDGSWIGESLYSSDYNSTKGVK